MRARDGTPACLLVGLGSPYRGDDAVGPLIVQQVARLWDAHTRPVQAVELEDPAALLDLLEGYDFALIVDAVRTGREPGSLVVLEAGAGAEAMPAGLRAGAGGGGSHALGLAACLELARVLDRLPHRLLVVGVEAAQFDPGGSLSAPVSAAVNGAVQTVTRLLSAPAGRAVGSP